MGRSILGYGFLLLVLLLLGGTVFLMNWDIPAPTTTVEKIIPHGK